MNKIAKEPLNRLGYDFIPAEFLPDGGDEYHLRLEQHPGDGALRALTGEEIETLTRNGNLADDWGEISVTDPFDPQLVRGCRFHGMIRIGALRETWLEHHDLRVPVGLYNSTIVSSDLGANVAIDRVGYLGHYIVGEGVILLNIEAMEGTAGLRDPVPPGHDTLSFRQGPKRGDCYTRILRILYRTEVFHSYPPASGSSCQHPLQGLQKLTPSCAYSTFRPRRGLPELFPVSRLQKLSS